MKKMVVKRVFNLMRLKKETVKSQFIELNKSEVVREIIYLIFNQGG